MPKKSGSKRIRKSTMHKMHYAMLVAVRCRAGRRGGGIIVGLVDPVSTRELNRQLNGDKTMSKGLMLWAAVLALTAEAQAHTEHKSSRVYATYSHCTPSNHVDLSHLQRGEM